MNKHIIFNINDVLIFKKPHPCGSYKWKVLKTGVNLKLECENCQRVIVIPRVDVYKKLSPKMKI